MSREQVKREKREEQKESRSKERKQREERESRGNERGRAERGSSDFSVSLCLFSNVKDQNGQRA